MSPPTIAASCACPAATHEQRRVVLTGGPGAGKTAVLAVVSQHLCAHVVVLPESAGIVFGGGFPRRESGPARRAGQRAIFHVQRELERLTAEEQFAAVVLCDRGGLDGLAYWPDAPERFFAELGTTAAEEYARYHTVIHLRTPSATQGYNYQNPLRIESAREAAAIDERVAQVWRGHPRLHVIESRDDFVGKLHAALTLIEAEVPACCRTRR